MNPDPIQPVFRATLRHGELIIRGRVGVSVNHDQPFLKPLGEKGDTLIFDLAYGTFHHSTHSVPDRPATFEHRVGAVAPHIRRLVIKLYNDREFVIERTSR